jgi:hypothetical protein
MDFIRPIHPDRDVNPVARVQRAKEDRERDQQRERSDQSPQSAAGSRQEEGPAEPEVQGPVEGDDGHLHIDIRA